MGARHDSPPGRDRARTDPRVGRAGLVARNATRALVLVLATAAACVDDDGSGDVDVADVDVGFEVPPAVEIAPGTYMRGEPDWSLGCSPWERPVHEVTLTRGFAMDATEVTREQWLELMSADPSQYSRDCPRCPVDSVSYYSAMEFANRRSRRDGFTECYTLGPCERSANRGTLLCDPHVVEWDVECDGYRLPTDAEWEYAARAGTATTYSCGEEGEVAEGVYCPGSFAWTFMNTEVDVPTWSLFAQPVASKRPNQWGLYDLLGNVHEWVWDAPYRYSEDPVADPIDDPSLVSSRGTAADDRTLRGGSVYSYLSECRPASRCLDLPAWMGGVDFASVQLAVGFRLVRTLE